MVIINEDLPIRRTLLCDISEKMRHLVEQAEEAQGKPSPQPLGTKRKRDPSPVRLQILENVQKGVERNRVLELWSGFLYGQSMTRPRSDWRFGRWVEAKHEYGALVQVHTFASQYGHIDAADASLDAIRQMLNSVVDLDKQPEWFAVTPKGGPCARLLMDFLANSHYGNMFTHNVERSLDMNSTRYLGGRRYMEPTLYESAELKSLLHATNELCKMLVRKIDDQVTSLVLRADLMERCRYHSHGSDVPCYLDKKAEQGLGDLKPAGVEAGNGPLILPYRHKRLRHDEGEDELFVSPRRPFSSERPLRFKGA
jgi:hypothetical protein